MITCLAIVLLSVHVKAQITKDVKKMDCNTPPPINIGSGSSYSFVDYSNNTGAISTAIESADRTQVSGYAGAIWQESDSRYNCHAWAWYLMGTLHGNKNYGTWPIWIEEGSCYGTTPCQPYSDPTIPCIAPPVYYYTSGLYVSTDECHASMVIYGGFDNPEHSAIRLTNGIYAGMYESKWGTGPLALHTLHVCPYCSNQPTFFKKSYENNIVSYDPITNSTMSGHGQICSSNATYSVTSVPGGARTIWDCDHSCLEIVSGQNTSTVTVHSIGTAIGWVSVKFESLACPNNLNLSNSTTLKKTVLVAIRNPDNITSISTSQYYPGPGTSTPINVPENTWVHFYCFPFVPDDLNDVTHLGDSHGVTNYSWECNPSSYAQNPEPNNARTALIAFNQLDYYTLTVTASNACRSVRYPQSIYVTGYFSLSPNPASTNVTVTILKWNNLSVGQSASFNTLPDSTTQMISIQSAPEVQTNVPVTYTVKIVNSFGSLFYSSKKTGDTFTIPVDNLRKGNYLVQISDGKTVSSQTLIISR